MHAPRVLSERWQIVVVGRAVRWLPLSDELASWDLLRSGFAGLIV